MHSGASVQVFQSVASVYDLLYADKDYKAECDMLEQVFSQFSPRPVRRILDLGCGTASHAIQLAKCGFGLVCVDQSEAMLRVARQKARSEDLTRQIQFKQSPIQRLSLRARFDAVISMFAVLSYQCSNNEVADTLRRARKNLRRGGLLVCDFWYGPAVLAQHPTERLKRVRNGATIVIRLAHPELNTLGNCVDVNYSFMILRGRRILVEMQETHRMRYFFKPEIELFLETAGFRLETFSSTDDWRHPPDERTWNAMLVARAI